MAGPGCGGDIGETRAVHVFEQPIGHEKIITWSPGAQIHIEIAVVVEIAVVAAHGGKYLIEPGSRGLILETAATDVTIEPIRPAGKRLPREPLHHALDSAEIGCSEDVDPPVVVVVPGPAWKSLLRAVNFQRV